jgi:hypothetical protein
MNHLDCYSILKVYALFPYKRASQVHCRNASKFTTDTLTRLRKALASSRQPKLESSAQRVVLYNLSVRVSTGGSWYDAGVGSLPVS